MRRALGPAARYGGAILVTGERGSGKTSAVNKAIFDCALLGRGLPDPCEEVPKRDEKNPSDDLERREPFSEHEFFEALDTRISEARKESGEGRKFSLRCTPRVLAGTWRSFAVHWQPTLVVDVPINLATPMNVDQLTRRLVRQFYWALVRHGVAGLAPKLVADARMACLRTTGKLQDIHDEAFKHSLTTTTRVSFGEKSISVEAGATASEELSIARRIAFEQGISSVEEMDEQLRALLDEIDGTVYGAHPTPYQRLTGIVDVLRLWLEGRGRQVLGYSGLRVNVVFVLDELDKLVLSHVDNPSVSGAPEKASGSRQLIRNVNALARAIKPVLTFGRATFVVVSGREDARRYVEETRNCDDLLESVFAEHVHFGPLGWLEAENLIRDRLVEADHSFTKKQHRAMADWLVFESDGRFKKAVSILRQLHTQRIRGQELWAALCCSGPRQSAALLGAVLRACFEEPTDDTGALAPGIGRPRDGGGDPLPIGDPVFGDGLFQLWRSILKRQVRGDDIGPRLSELVAACGLGGDEAPLVGKFDELCDSLHDIAAMEFQRALGGEAGSSSTAGGGGESSHLYAAYEAARKQLEPGEGAR